MLIKQIHQGNQSQGLFIPFFSQQYVTAICFWTSCMHILGMHYDIEEVTEELAEKWNKQMKTELEAAKAPNKLIKIPEAFQKDSKWRV
jgi:hypothetical protein